MAPTTVPFTCVPIEIHQWGGHKARHPPEQQGHGQGWRWLGADHVQVPGHRDAVPSWRSLEGEGGMPHGGHEGLGAMGQWEGTALGAMGQ